MSDTAKDVKKEAGPPEKGERTRERRIYKPAVDIIEMKDAIELIADMPGIDEKSVDITLEKNELTIYARVDHEIPQGFTLSLVEYGVGDYHRVFTLSDEVDRDKIQALVKGGVLRLVLPKAAAVKARKIDVQAGA